MPVNGSFLAGATYKSMDDFIARTRKIGGYNPARPGNPTAPYGTTPSGPIQPSPMPGGVNPWGGTNPWATRYNPQTGQNSGSPAVVPQANPGGFPTVPPLQQKPVDILQQYAQPAQWKPAPGAVVPDQVVDMPGQTPITIPKTPAAGAVPDQVVDMPGPAPITVPKTAAPTTTPGATPSSSDALYDDVLKQLAAGINSDQPLPGTAAAIQQNRQALATYAKGAQAAAGQVAARGGSLGQGTANQLGQQTRQDVLGRLANTELENTKLVSAEKQGLIDKAIQAGQYGKTLQEGSRQFNENLGQRRTEFEKTFGAEESRNYINTLERMSVDNPILAAKLTDYLLDGKTGKLGDFTATEREQIKTYAAEKKGQQDKLTAVYNKILEGIPGQINEGNAEAEKSKNITTYTEKLNKLGPNDVLTDDEFKTLEGAGSIPKYTLSTLTVSQDGLKEIQAKSPSGVISLAGEQYKVKDFASEVTGYHSVGVWPAEDRRANHTDYFILQDSKGNTKYLWKGQIRDAPPQKVT